MVYFIGMITYDRTKDRSGYFDYIEQAQPIVERYGGRYLIRSDAVTAVDGEQKPDRMLILEFDPREQLDACFSSTAYRKIAGLRERSVISRAFIVE